MSYSKKWSLKKIETKTILADWRKLKFQEKVFQNFWWNSASIGSQCKT